MPFLWSDLSILLASVLGPSELYKHAVRVRATRYTPLDGQGLPTGDILTVDNSRPPIDLRAMRNVGRTIAKVRQMQFLQMGLPVEQRLKAGIKLNFIAAPAATAGDVSKNSGKRKSGGGYQAKLIHKKSGRTLEVRSDQPCVLLQTCE